MAGSNNISDENVKITNVFERVKEEISEKMHFHHNKETHGNRDDIDEHTRLGDVKAPNVFERAKEEIEALIQTVHNHKDENNRDQMVKSEGENDRVKPSSNLLERAKEEIEVIIYHEKSQSHDHHYKETHGRNGDIDENTPIDEVKGPSMFQRAKEEIEALVETVHPKKEKGNLESSHVKEKEEREEEKNGGFGASIGKGLEKVCSPESGFGASIGKGLEKVCSPWGTKRD